jgi:hypothetical protein
MLSKFISEHYINENVDVYCGPPSNFSGTVIACADDVLTLETEDEGEKYLTHIAINKIIAIWKQI